MTPSLPALREEGVYDRRLGPDDQPFSIFVPQKLEERYAYPLLVFLHSHGEDERQWLSQMIHLSRRNYIGLALRGPHRVIGKGGRPGYGWGRDRVSVSSIEDYALSAIDDVRSRFRINPRSIHLAGFGEGASLALQLGLASPSRFSAIVAFNGWLPAFQLPIGTGPQRLRGVQSPRVLLGYGSSALEDEEKGRQAFALLNAAGLTVELRAYASASRLTQAMLRDADRWLMGWWNWS